MPVQKKSGNVLNTARMYKEDLALNNLQWLICHKTQPTNQLSLSFDFILWFAWITKSAIW